MSKNRKNKFGSLAEKKPLIEISEEEQWRLIQESGLLNRINTPDQRTPARTQVTTTDVDDGPPPLAEEIFNALVIIMPHTFFLIMMDILIHHQYAKQPTIRDIADRLVNTFPIMAIFMFYTVRHKDDTIAQLALFLLSLGVGPRMIWLVNRGSWLTNLAQCPQVATIWLYTVVQLRLSLALLSLALIGGWTWWTGLRLLL
ncbi:hypothetical protein PAXRUDRAFT_823544 [Paxillus rubicundulus Ve08.2h10]|uniref:DUF7719 domain-containing protein n=1 Tax=Paxillus rubicundulus Ve08.2h10 TaxID=930991 RepID=A0A0D0E3I1_9AGAM|nr:hypothetical protein PAXRUDRAFT_823544 [Paxillus rubicundulus Ve08.2h10]